MAYPNSQFLIETHELESRLSEPDLRILDCTVNVAPKESGGYDFIPAQDVWKSGHIPGSTFVDFNRELADASSDLPYMLPSEKVFGEVMANHGIGKGTNVVVYDGFFNMWAARLWWMLRAYGVKDVAVLNGGITKWKSENRPMSTEQKAPAPGDFVARLTGESFVGKDEVLAAIDDQKTVLLDANEPGHYSGETEAPVPRQGHIKSAKNFPWLTVLDMETQTFLPEDQLKDALDRLGLGDANRVIAYCHAGIGSSLIAFALALMGLKDVAIYDGSLFEWTADPNLPMETSPEASKEPGHPRS